MTIGQLLNFGTEKLSKTSDSPALDAEVLLSHVLDKPKSYLFVRSQKYVTSSQETKFKVLLNRRLLGWPVAYLTNQKEFFGSKFIVDRNVLIPRPETEGLVELVLSKIKDPAFAKASAGRQRSLSILDIGTGSGNIIVSLAKAFSNSRELENSYFASDISASALKVAKKNAKFHNVKITFKQGSLLDPWKNQKFDIIIANLPYLAKQTDPSTKFEPKSALLAANKGLALYEKLFKQIAQPNLPKFIFLEIGHDQPTRIKKLAKKYLPEYRTKIFKDLTARSRFAVLAQKSS